MNMNDATPNAWQSAAAKHSVPPPDTTWDRLEVKMDETAKAQRKKKARLKGYLVNAAMVLILMSLGYFIAQESSISPAAVHGQIAEWEELNVEDVEFYDQGAVRALHLAYDALGR